MMDADQVTQEYVQIRKAAKTLDPREVAERSEVLAVYQRNHICTRCGQCCIKSDPIGMTGKEVVTIANFLGLKPSTFRERFVHGHTGHWLLMRKGEGEPCPFLEGEGNGHRCAIYPVRPMVCRVYPWLSHITIIRTDFPHVAVDDSMCPNMTATFNKVRDMFRGPLQ